METVRGQGIVTTEPVGDRKAAFALMLKNIVINIVYYSMTAVLIPWTVLSVERRSGDGSSPWVGVQLGAVFLFVAGCALQLRCIVVFQRVGKGTPSPLLPPRKLVVSGPYRWVRNPMNIGELLVLSALAAWFLSPGLFLYVLLAWGAFHWFIVSVEEARLAEEFAEEYARYKVAVNRWLPMLASNRPRREG